MSAKYFCDLCRKELAKSDHKRLRKRLGELEVEIMHTWKGCSNDGNICHTCIKKCVTKGVVIKPKHDAS